MPTDPVFNEVSGETIPSYHHLFRLLAVAVVAGLLTGVLGTLFRMALEEANHRRDLLLLFSRSLPGWGWLLPVVVIALCVVLARYLVRFQPLASGSGVQLVEAMMRGEAPLRTPWVVPVKFFGGVLAIGSGLALGREGPTVQMGSSVGLTLSRWLRLSADETCILQGAAAGAGLAVAFNAPLGGAIFVFEELARRFTVRLMIITLVACGTAIAVSRLIIGDHAIYPVTEIAPPPFWSLAPYLVFGLLVGLLGALYNRNTITGIDLFNRCADVPLLLRAAAVGATVGLVAWFFPELVGGGETLNGDLLRGSFSLSFIVLALVCRWFLGPFSYAPGTPGGLFAPMLVVGALVGLLFGNLLDVLIPAAGLQPTAFAMVGMAAFFAAVVRAPLTGIALVIEMTANTTLLVPLLVASSGSALVAEALKSQPIYDHLRDRMLKNEELERQKTGQSDGATGQNPTSMER